MRLVASARTRVSIPVPIKKKRKPYTKRVVTPANWRRVNIRLARLEQAIRKLRKRLQKVGI